MNWEAIGIILGAVGGIEIFKFIYNLFIRRKTDARIAIAEAKTSEFEQLKSTNEWLQSQLQAKEERFEEQTRLVRAQNHEILNLTKEKAEMEIQWAKERADYEIQLAEVRCDDKDCPFRWPPNAFTPPHPGTEKEEYMQSRLRSVTLVKKERASKK